MKKAFVLIFSLFLICSLYAKDSIPNGYGGVELGMSLSQTKKALKQNMDFGYHGDRDVSLLPGENRALIETDASRYGYSFLERCWFQFYQDKLYIITVNINQEKMDHYSIFSTLCKKYGDPVSLNPEKAVWLAVKGMLPKNSIGAKSITRVKIYAEGNHNQQAQKPVEYPVD